MSKYIGIVEPNLELALFSCMTYMYHTSNWLTMEKRFVYSGQNCFAKRRGREQCGFQKKLIFINSLFSYPKISSYNTFYKTIPGDTIKNIQNNLFYLMYFSHILFLYWSQTEY